MILTKSEEFKISNLFKISDNVFGIINNGILIFFFYMKFILVFILAFIGILTLAKLRGIYLHERLGKIDQEENQLRKPRLILGTVYIFLALGIMFNFLVYFLIWIFSLLYRPLIFDFLDLLESDIYDLSRIDDYNTCEHEFEKSLYLLFALFSFEAFIHLILTIWYLINNNRSISNPRKVLMNLTWSLSLMIFFGGIFLPFFL